MPATSSAAAVRELDALATISHLVGRSHDLADTFHSVMDVIGDAFGMERGTLSLLDPETNAVTIRIGHGLDDEAIRRGHYSLGEGITGRVAATGEPCVIPDIYEEPEFLNRTGARPDATEVPLAFLCVPVLMEGRVIGVLSADKRAAHPRGLERDLQLLDIVGGILSQSMRLHSTVAELEAVKSEADAILSSMTNAVIAMDPMGRVTSLNPAAEQMFGVRATRALHTAYDRVFRGHGAFTRLLAAIINTDPDQTSTDLTIFPPDGEAIPANLVWSRLRARTGEPRGIIVTVQDRTELRRLERQVRRAQRLAALGTMAAGVAHEVRNPLAGIRGAAQLAGKRVGHDPKLTQYVDLIMSEVERLDGIVEQLVRFASPQKPSRKRASLRDVAEHALSLVRRQAEQVSVACAAEEPTPVPAVSVDTHQLTQVFLNLYLNAIQAMPDGGRLTVRVLLDSGPRPGEQVAVAQVQDTGNGIDRRTLDKLFTPFFTTKAEGTGLGLAIAHRIMEEHGGGLDVVSAPGAGSTFYVSVPIVGET